MHISIHVLNDKSVVETLQRLQTMGYFAQGVPNNLTMTIDVVDTAIGMQVLGQVLKIPTVQTAYLVPDDELP